MKVPSKNLIAVFTWITLSLLVGLVEAKVRVPFLLENIFIADTAPTKQFCTLVPFPPLSIGVRYQGGRKNCLVTAIGRNHPKSHMSVEASVINNEFCLLVDSPRIVFHNSKSVGN